MLSLVVITPESYRWSRLKVRVQISPKNLECDNAVSTQVFPITDAAGTGTPTVGAVIQIGSNLRAIAADRSSNIWVAGSTVADTVTTNDVYVIARGANTVATAAGLTYAAGATELTGTMWLPFCRCELVPLQPLRLVGAV